MNCRSVIQYIRDIIEIGSYKNIYIHVLDIGIDFKLNLTGGIIHPGIVVSPSWTIEYMSDQIELSLQSILAAKRISTDCSVTLHVPYKHNLSEHLLASLGFEHWNDGSEHDEYGYWWPTNTPMYDIA